MLYIFDMDFVKTEVLGHDGMPKSGRYYRPANFWMVCDLEKDVWFTTPYLTPYFRAIRRASAHAFSSSHLRATLPRLQKIIARAIERIEEERVMGPVDLQELFLDMTTDIIGAVGFDMHFGGLEKTSRIPSLLREAFKQFDENNFKPHLRLYMKLFPNSKPALARKTTAESLFAEFRKITNTFMSRPYPDENTNALWASLRKLLDPDTNKPVEAEKLYGDVATLVIAGMDTTGHQLAWILAILSDYPDVVDRILDELKSNQLCGPDARDLKFEDIAELKYLNAVIKECMRIVTSTVSSGIREVAKDMSILGYRVPKGTQIFVPENVYTHMEEFYDDPKVFRPERWMGDKAKDNLAINFSYGPRDCVGQKLGIFEMQVTLIRLLPKYKFTLTDGTYDDVRRNRAYDAIVVSAEGGLPFNIEERCVT